MTDIELRCAACGSEHPQGKRFCADCGARLPVLCSACHAPQPAENHFCQDCGAALEGWCPSCGHAVSRGKAFCGTCGASLGSGAVPHGVPGAASVRGEAEREERRLVTALFCDLTGFTPLTERLDAEQIREIQSDYFQRMSGEIARFGGHVEKYAGDAVLALFGVPSTHGDDAERALLCALAMQEAIGSLASDARQRWQVDLGLRVGVNTGEAVSGLTDVAGRKDYSVTGDVLNTAARLQTAAEPGTVMAGEETMRLARKTVRFGERRELALKGKARPVPAYQVLGRRELLHERFDDQSQTPLVGRDHELGILREAWTRAESGEGQLVTVVGDAGLGKSRLIAEVTTLQEPLNRAVYRARGVSYGQDISLSLIAELVRSILRVNDQEDPALVRQRLDEMIQTLPAGELEEGAATAAGVLGELLGLGAADEAPAGTEAQARRRELVKTLRLLLLASSRRNPTIILFDDLQWIDSASAEVLTEVLGDIVSLRICVLAAHRPGWSAPWSEWPWIERLNLRPLKSDDARALAQRIAGDARISPDLHRYIDDRAGGNPFFIEELLLILRETGSIVERDGRLELVGGTADRLPSTLTEILLARLDSLDDTSRGLVQIASVIGRDFDVELLANVLAQAASTLDVSLQKLLRTEIVAGKPGAPGEYSFKHAAMIDVAYHTLLSDRRAELHGAVARAILALRSPEEPVDVVAYHLARTEDHADAAVWLEKAADHAADVYANQAAIGHYEEAKRRLELMKTDPSVLARIALKTSDVFVRLSWYDEALEELESAAETYRELSDRVAESEAVARIGEVHFLRGAPQDAIERVQKVMSRLDQDDEASSSGVSALYGALVEPLSALYRHEDALTAAWRSLELARSVGDERILVEATVRYGLALFGMGLLHEARATLEEGLAGAEKLDLGGPLSRSLCLLGAIAMAQGRTTDAHVYLTASMTIADERADVAAIVAVEERLGSLAFVLGNWDDALFHRKHAVDLVQSISFAHFSAMTLLALGEQYLLQGDTDSASRYLEEPFTLAERSGQTVQLPRLEIPLAANDRREGNPRRALQRLEPLIDRPAFETAPDHEPMLVAAEAYLEIGDEQRAEEIIEQGLTFARDQEHRLVIVEWLQLKSILAERRGRRPQAIALLDDALTLARAIPYPYQEALTLHRLGMLTGELDHLIAARDIFQRLGARPFAGRVEDLEMWHSYADNKSTSELSPTVEATMENETTPR